MGRVIMAPGRLTLAPGERSIFLAGSIEMGRAEPWQSGVAHALRDLDVVILNPRRDDWDASWKQTIDDPQFRAQVEWELSAQELATLILMYFAPTTKSPITLLELGLFAGSSKLVVCCPDGYWRKGNVDIVCARYGAETVKDLGALILRARELLHA
jgi:hypothetical protein